METDDQSVNKGRTSLLTLADLALALQDQGEDHTYARIHEVPQVLDEQSLIVKEKDHNYSTCSRTELRGRAKYNMKRSSSEENLTTVCAENFSLISKKSQSCEQVVNSQSEDSSACEPVVTGELDVSQNLLCSSWPKENTFKDFMNDDGLSVKLIEHEILSNQQTVYDHSYARFKNNVPLVRNEHNYDIREKFSFNDPRKITSKKLKNSKYISHNKQSEPTLFNTLKNSSFDFDHNYTFRCMQSHQPSGSVESLDMDFSDSDTDSCDETVEEESKMHHVQMMNTQQDHPYSKSSNILIDSA